MIMNLLLGLLWHITYFLALSFIKGLCNLHMIYIIYRSRCHGNVRINDDSKSHRIIPIAWRVLINPIYVRGGQSARDDKSHIR